MIEETPYNPLDKMNLGESVADALLIDGFGNHDPGKGRYNQMRSRWDTLHPGRSWAVKCKKRSETSKQIIGELEEFLRELLE